MNNAGISTIEEISDRLHDIDDKVETIGIITSNGLDEILDKMDYSEL